jgi:spore coat-associated protein N
MAVLAIRRRWYPLIGALAVAVVLVAYLASASFLGDATATHATSTAVVEITIGPEPNLGNQLTIPIDNLLPGDQALRAFALNVGDVELSAVSLTTEATTSSVLDTDADIGLYLAMARCSIPFDFAPGAGPGGMDYITDCSGDLDMLFFRPVIFEDQPLIGLDLDEGATNYLAVVVPLPAEADESFSGAQSVIRLTFTGTARAPVGN